MIAVWDRFVRIAHWSLVVCVTAAWLTRHAGAIHEWLGYAVSALVVARTLWGVVGSRHARFADFVRSPRATWAYAREVFAYREPRHVGHNPLGGWMIVALLATLAFVCASGWMLTTDRFWGVEQVEDAHAAASDLLLALIALHVAGVLFSSIRHHENLIAAMLTGRKRAP